MTTCSSGRPRRVRTGRRAAHEPAPPALAGVLEEAVARGVAVVLTTRCLRGGVYPIYAYSGGGAQLLRAGLINGQGLTSDKALLLLKVALGCGCNVKAIEALCAYYGRA